MNDQAERDARLGFAVLSVAVADRVQEPVVMSTAERADSGKRALMQGAGKAYLLTRTDDLYVS